MKEGATPQERLEAMREDFLNRNWPTPGDLSLKWGASVEARSELTSRLRQEKRLFGVWSPRHGTYVHPLFQFIGRNPDSQHAVLPALPALLVALEDIPGFSDRETDVAGGDPGRWRRLFWLYSPRAELSKRSVAGIELQDSGVSAREALVATDGVDESPRTPADMFSEVPGVVIAVARQDATDDLGPL